MSSRNTLPRAPDRGGVSVMSSRREPADSLEFFPTPPWATRALFEHVLPPIGVEVHCASDPMCGQGHMAAVMHEYTRDGVPVHAADVFDYGYGRVEDFFKSDGPAGEVWRITNPAFKISRGVAVRALRLSAYAGIALLLRAAWLEGGDRYEQLFRDNPPTLVAPFVERVPMTKGRFDPDASTATAYAWFVWAAGIERRRGQRAEVLWIPPGCKKALTRPDDRARFAAWSVTPPAIGEIEQLARELAIGDGADLDATTKVRRHASLTYTQSRAFKPNALGEQITAPAWHAFIRRADDILAGQITVKAIKAGAKPRRYTEELKLGHAV